MLKENITIESLILCLAGIKPLDESIDPPKIERSDYNLIQSFARQVLRNIGFTDRQYELAKRKVDDYADYFSFVEDLESAKNEIIIPIREIDRSRWIKLIEDKIAIRFTFQKKLISSIEAIKRASSNDSQYDAKEKIHYFEYSEKLLFCLVDELKDKNFVIEDKVQAIYNKISEFKAEDYIPGVYNLEVKNIPSIAKDMLEKELGTVNTDNLLLYKDRSLKYGLTYFDNIEQGSFSELSFKVASRKEPYVLVKDTKFNLGDLINTIYELDRFPLLCIVPSDQTYDYIVQFNEHARNLIPSNETSVMFRLDNTGEGIYFNNYIKQQKINNKLDTNTKLVYNIDNKVPKPLLNSSWRPNAIFVMNEGKGTPYIKKVLECFPHTDLVLFQQEEFAPNFSRYFVRENMDSI